jgi:hypothetical protein
MSSTRRGNNNEGERRTAQFAEAHRQSGFSAEDIERLVEVKRLYQNQLTDLERQYRAANSQERRQNIQDNIIRILMKETRDLNKIFDNILDRQLHHRNHAGGRRRVTRRKL